MEREGRKEEEEEREGGREGGDVRHERRATRKREKKDSEVLTGAEIDMRRDAYRELCDLFYFLLID